MPSTALRTPIGTGRDAAASASALPLQASAAPMAMPAPTMTPVSPCASASVARPAA